MSDHSKYHIVSCKFDGKTVYFDSNFDEYCYPFWISFPPLYMSHQAALCRKESEYYRGLLREELKPFLSNGYLWSSNVTNECYTNLNFSHHEPLSCGCPPEYKLKIPEILKLSISPLINPLTGRTITLNSDIYKDFSKAFEKS